MRKMICAVMAALMLLSTGCSSMLNRDYSSVTVHSATPTAEGDANTMRVQNYQELVNALIYLINQGEESGSIRYSGEEADFKKLMDEACLEVKQEDPLGAYAVDYIKYSVISIVGSYEADVQITYRRTREQVASIVDATGAAAIRSELSRALSSFDTEVVLRISYFEEDEAYIQQLVRQAGFSRCPGGHVPRKRPAADRGSYSDLPPVSADAGELAQFPLPGGGAYLPAVDGADHQRKAGWNYRHPAIHGGVFCPGGKHCL